MASTVWKGHINFGLVSIPIKLSCAARAESIAFCQLRASDLSRVGQSLYAKNDNTPVTKDEIVRGFEISKDRYIVITPEDLAGAAPDSDKTAEITEFVPASEVDPGLFEQSYWMAPDVGGDKAYALLYDGLKRTGYVGVAKLTMGNREHIIVLRAGKSGISVHTIYYQHEARAADEYRTDLSRVSEGESELAGMLMNALASHFEPASFRDTYRENLLEMIEAKGQGNEAPAPQKKPVRAEATDIMDALRASLAAKKPAAPPPAPGPVEAPPAPRKRRAA
jgi:DNA end-binding protein Ku